MRPLIKDKVLPFRDESRKWNRTVKYLYRLKGFKDRYAIKFVSADGRFCISGCVPVTREFKDTLLRIINGELKCGSTDPVDLCGYGNKPLVSGNCIMLTNRDEAMTTYIADIFASPESELDMTLFSLRKLLANRFGQDIKYGSDTFAGYETPTYKEDEYEVIDDLEIPDREGNWDEVPIPVEEVPKPSAERLEAAKKFIDSFYGQEKPNTHVSGGTVEEKHDNNEGKSEVKAGATDNIDPFHEGNKSEDEKEQ